MPSKIALVDYGKCCPDKCENGVCKAANACKNKLLIQEVPYDIPMASPFLCRVCGDCVRACPVKAVRIVSA